MTEGWNGLAALRMAAVEDDFEVVEEVREFNPYHDSKGRFAHAPGGRGGVTAQRRGGVIHFDAAQYGSPLPPSLRGRLGPKVTHWMSDKQLDKAVEGSVGKNRVERKIVAEGKEVGGGYRIAAQHRIVVSQPDGQYHEIGAVGLAKNGQPHYVAAAGRATTIQRAKDAAYYHASHLRAVADKYVPDGLNILKDPWNWDNFYSVAEAVMQVGEPLFHVVAKVLGAEAAPGEPGELAEFNPYHDSLGRFTTKGGMAGNTEFVERPGSLPLADQKAIMALDVYLDDHRERRSVTDLIRNPEAAGRNFDRQLSGWERDPMFVARDESGVIRGAATYMPANRYFGPYPRLAQIAVDPTMRREGIGRALVGQILERARAEGYSKVTITENENKAYWKSKGAVYNRAAKRWELAVPKLLEAVRVAEFNPYHDRLGRFTYADKFGGSSAAAAATVWDTAANNPDGFSISIRTGKSPRRGYMVSERGHSLIMSDAEFFDGRGAKVIADYIKANRSRLIGKGKYLGGWHDTEHHEFVLDISNQVLNRKTAIRLGKRRNQQAIYDIKHDTLISTGGTGDRPTSEGAAEQGVALRAAAEHRPDERRGNRRDGGGHLQGHEDGVRTAEGATLQESGVMLPFREGDLDHPTNVTDWVLDVVDAWKRAGVDKQKPEQQARWLAIQVHVASEEGLFPNSAALRVGINRLERVMGKAGGIQVGMIADDYAKNYGLPGQKPFTRPQQAGAADIPAQGLEGVITQRIRLGRILRDRFGQATFNDASYMADQIMKQLDIWYHQGIIDWNQARFIAADLERDFGFPLYPEGFPKATTGGEKMVAGPGESPPAAGAGAKPGALEPLAGGVPAARQRVFDKAFADITKAIGPDWEKLDALHMAQAIEKAAKGVDLVQLTTAQKAELNQKLADKYVLHVASVEAVMGGGGPRATTGAVADEIRKRVGPGDRFIGNSWKLYDRLADEVEMMVARGRVNVENATMVAARVEGYYQYQFPTIDNEVVKRIQAKRDPMLAALNRAVINNPPEPLNRQAMFDALNQQKYQHKLDLKAHVGWRNAQRHRVQQVQQYVRNNVLNQAEADRVLNQLAIDKGWKKRPDGLAIGPGFEQAGIVATDPNQRVVRDPDQKRVAGGAPLGMMNLEQRNKRMADAADAIIGHMGGEAKIAKLKQGRNFDRQFADEVRMRLDNGDIDPDQWPNVIKNLQFKLGVGVLRAQAVEDEFRQMFPSHVERGDAYVRGGTGGRDVFDVTGPPPKAPTFVPPNTAKMKAVLKDMDKWGSRDQFSLANDVAIGAYHRGSLDQMEYDVVQNEFAKKHGLTKRLDGQPIGLGFESLGITVAKDYGAEFHRIDVQQNPVAARVALIRWMQAGAITETEARGILDKYAAPLTWPDHNPAPEPNARQGVASWLIEWLKGFDIPKRLGQYNAVMRPPWSNWYNAGVINGDERDAIAQAYLPPILGTPALTPMTVVPPPIQLDRILAEAFMDTKDIAGAAVGEGLRRAQLGGYGNAAKQLGLRVNLDLANPRAVAYAKARADVAIEGVNDTTAKWIHALVANGLADGASYQRIASKIRKEAGNGFTGAVPQLHIRDRAELIAVNEMGQAYADGNFAIYKYLEDTGVKMMKRWIAVGDERTCPICRGNYMVGWIDLDEPFPSGQMTAIAHPACRCDVAAEPYNPQSVGAFRRYLNENPLPPYKPGHKVIKKPKPYFVRPAGRKAAPQPPLAPTGRPLRPGDPEYVWPGKMPELGTAAPAVKWAGYLKQNFPDAIPDQYAAYVDILVKSGAMPSSIRNEVKDKLGAQAFMSRLTAVPAGDAAWPQRHVAMPGTWAGGNTYAQYIQYNFANDADLRRKVVDAMVDQGKLPLDKRFNTLKNLGIAPTRPQAPAFDATKFPPEQVKAWKDYYDYRFVKQNGEVNMHLVAKQIEKDRINGDITPAFANLLFKKYGADEYIMPDLAGRDPRRVRVDPWVKYVKRPDLYGDTPYSSDIKDRVAAMNLPPELQARVLKKLASQGDIHLPQPKGPPIKIRGAKSPEESARGSVGASMDGLAETNGPGFAARSCSDKIWVKDSDGNRYLLKTTFGTSSEYDLDRCGPYAERLADDIFTLLGIDTPRSWVASGRPQGLRNPDAFDEGSATRGYAVQEDWTSILARRLHLDPKTVGSRIHDGGSIDYPEHFEADPAQVSRILLGDFLCGNEDRHAYNLLWYCDPDSGKAMALPIDQSLCFAGRQHMGDISRRYGESIEDWASDSNGSPSTILGPLRRMKLPGVGTATPTRDQFADMVRPTIDQFKEQLRDDWDEVEKDIVKNKPAIRNPNESADDIVRDTQHLLRDRRDTILNMSDDELIDFMYGYINRGY